MLTYPNKSVLRKPAGGWENSSMPSLLSQINRDIVTFFISAKWPNRQ